jgi:hypothetical protein
MPSFIFVTTDAAGDQRQIEQSFPLQTDAIRNAGGIVQDGGQVRVGQIIGGDVEWIGAWSRDAGPQAWEAAV